MQMKRSKDTRNAADSTQRNLPKLCGKLFFKRAKLLSVITRATKHSEREGKKKYGSNLGHKPYRGGGKKKYEKEKSNLEIQGCNGKGRMGNPQLLQ